MVAVGEVQVSFEDTFWPSVSRLDPGQSHRVIDALNLFREHPEHPHLKLKPLKSDLKGLWSARAGSDVRILMERRGDMFVWIEAGQRKEIYDKAARGRFVVHPERRFIGFLDPDVPADERRQPVPTGDPVLDQRPGVFDHWTDAELRGAGLDDQQIADLRSVTDEYDLLTLPWPQERTDLVLQLVELTPEQWASQEVDENHAADRMRLAIEQYGGLTGLSPLYTSEELQRIAAAPIEDWMIFLHPEQRSVVEQRYAGPARVRGAAGTGKTVVALHRAAFLARTFEEEDPGGRILFTTFIRSLPPVFRRLYERLPDRVDGAVDFLHLDVLAGDLCAELDIRPPIDTGAIDDAFRTACDGVVTAGSPLERAGVSPAYLRTEIQKVMKGRGVKDVNEYLTVARTGRRVGFTETMRRQAWDLRESWDAEMTARGTVDFPDVVLRARDLAATAGARYRAVIVDEAQDLTLVGLQLLRSLVNGANGRDRPDGLFLAGDGAQRVYPGGFTLRQAGVEVRGRTTVLKVNYRNTAEILEAALAAAGSEEIVDLDEEFQRGELTPETLRHGARPNLVQLADAEEEQRFLVEQIRDLSSSSMIGLGDIAVFLPSNDLVSSTLTALDASGVPARNLTDYEGETSEDVKVGTWIRAKGLEFKAVFLPGLSADRVPTPRRQGEGADEYEERRSLELGRLFVAMTRARDVLVLSSPGRAAPPIEGALHALDREDRPSHR